MIFFVFNMDAFSTNNGKDENNAFLATILQSSHNEFVDIHNAQSATTGASTAHPNGDSAETVE